MPNAITLENITRSFRNHFWQRSREVLKGISLDIQKGEVFGFLGPNGAGKTTTIKIITGLIRPDSGCATIFGLHPNSLAAKRRIGFLPESPYFYEHLTGYEFIKIHAMLSGSNDEEDDVMHLVERVGLADARDVQLRSYSRGMLQRIGIAQALVGSPDLLILDEPLTGLDPIGRKDIKDLILEEKDKGTTIFFSSHILPDAEAVCDRVGIIIEGQMREVGRLNDVLKRDIETDAITLEEWFVRHAKKLE
ncbi:MAG: ABC transporter ATP-binding protein [candidate division WOR-3 bacterium]|nr:MAG: ABC transporter ATP-binding protein [candidate division WOR-3 bacterium]